MNSASLRNYRNSVKNFFPGNNVINNFSFPRTGNKQFFEVGLRLNQEANESVLANLHEMIYCNI